MGGVGCVEHVLSGVRDAQCVMHACVVHDAWRRCLVRGVWCEVRGAWCVVRGAWYVVVTNRDGGSDLWLKLIGAT